MADGFTVGCRAALSSLFRLDSSLLEGEMVERARFSRKKIRHSLEFLLAPAL